MAITMCYKICGVVYIFKKAFSSSSFLANLQLNSPSFPNIISLLLKLAKNIFAVVTSLRQRWTTKGTVAKLIIEKKNNKKQ